MKNDYSCQTSCQSMNNVHNAPLAKTLKSLQGKLMLFSLRLFQVDFQARAVFLMRTSRPNTIWHLRKTLNSQCTLFICLQLRSEYSMDCTSILGCFKMANICSSHFVFSKLIVRQEQFFMGTSHADTKWHVRKNLESSSPVI